MGLLVCLLGVGGAEVGVEQFRVAEKAHGSWMKLYLEGNTSEVLANVGKKVLRQYLEALASMSSALGKQLGKYDMYSMVAGMVVVFQVSSSSHCRRIHLPAITALNDSWMWGELAAPACRLWAIHSRRVGVIVITPLGLIRYLRLQAFYNLFLMSFIVNLINS